MKYPFVLLDADDTLFDFPKSQQEAFFATLRAYNETPTEEHLAFFHQENLQLWGRYQRGEITQAELRKDRFVALANYFSLSAPPGELCKTYVEALSAQANLLPGAAAFIRRLFATGHRLGLVTNGITQVQKSRLQHSGLQPYFGAVAISEEVGAPKPKPDMLFYALKQLGHAGEPVFLLGDSLETDIPAALAAGSFITPCWYNPASLPGCPEGVKQVKHYGEVYRWLL